MITQHANHIASTTTPVKVIERSLHSSYGVFTELLSRQGKIKPIEKAVLQHLYTSLKTSTNCTLHCVLYLEVPATLAGHRVSWRGREEERQANAVDLGYLQQVEDTYEDFFRALPVPVIRVDGDREPSVILNDVLDKLSELCPFIESPFKN
jgi:deoxyadenosine/deoxycytidine kinase